MYWNLKLNVNLSVLIINNIIYLNILPKLILQKADTIYGVDWEQ